MSLTRTSTLDRSGRSVSICDKAEFSTGGNKIELPLYCVPEIKTTGPTQAEIKINNKVLILDVESENNCDIAIEKINIEDPVLKENWSSKIFKVSLNFATDDSVISYRLTIKEK